MPARDHRRDAGRADLADVTGTGAQGRRSGFIIRISGKGAHRSGQLGIAFERGSLFEIGLGQRAEFGLEVIGADLLQRGGELDDRIYRTRGRAVAAGVGHFELVIVVSLFRALPGPVQRLAGLFIERAAAAIDVKHQFGARQLLGDHPRAAHGGFFITRELQNDGPLGLVARTAQFDQAGGCQRSIELHIARPAAEQVTVLDHRGERIALPVRRLGFDHVHMPGNHQRLEAGIAARPGSDQVSSIAKRGDLHLAILPSARDQRLLDQLQRFTGLVAFALDRAQRDQLHGKRQHLRLGRRMRGRFHWAGGKLRRGNPGKQGDDQWGEGVAHRRFSCWAGFSHMARSG